MSWQRTQHWELRLETILIKLELLLRVKAQARARRKSYYLRGDCKNRNLFAYNLCKAELDSIDDKSLKRIIKDIKEEQ